MPLATILNLANQLIQESNFHLRNGNWKPDSRIIYEYDDSKNLIFQGGFYWSSEKNDWLYNILLQGEWAYSENGTLIKEIRYGVSDMIYGGFHDVFRFLTYYAIPSSSNNNIMEEKDDFQLFPNPTNQFLTIKLPEITTFPLNLTIFNQQGQLLKQQEVNANLETLNLEAIPKGAYFIKIQDEFGKIMVSKIMRQ